MMKFILYISVLFISYQSIGNSQATSKMRDLFTKVDQDEKYNTQLKNLTDSATEKTPIAYGYKALYYFMNAKYVFWPTDKLSNFSTGKSYLEQVIKLYPNEAELRLIRYSVQYNVPSLLNYSHNMEEDKKILQRAAFHSKYEDIRALINGVLNKYP